MQTEVRIERLVDLLRENYALTAVCWTCGNEARLDVLRLVIARGATYRIKALKKHLRCRRCGGRGARLGMSWLYPPTTSR